jgi:hypothetical protein
MLFKQQRIISFHGSLAGVFQVRFSILLEGRSGNDTVSWAISHDPATIFYFLAKAIAWPKHLQN